MTFLKAGTHKATPADHVIDPTYPNTYEEGHGYPKAHMRGCRCPGPSLELHRIRRNSSRRPVPSPTPKAVKPAPKPEKTRRNGPLPASSAERELRERNDLACRHVDDELFYVTGSGGTADAQIKAARAVCAACPLAAQRLCLQAAIERGDDWAILAGTTPQQRRELKQQQDAA